MSLRARLLLMVAALALPGAGVLGYFAWGQYAGVKEAGYGRVLAAARTAAQGSGTMIELVENLTTAFAQQEAVRLLDPAECPARVTATRDLLPFFAGLSVVDPTGAIVCAALPVPDPAPSAADRAWFVELMETGDFVVSEPLLGRVTRAYVTVLAAPLRDQDGTLAGAVAGGLRLTEFAEMLRGFVPDSLATITITDEEGLVTARTADMEDFAGREIGPAVDPVLREGSDWRIFRTISESGVPRLVARVDLPERRWRVYAGFDEEPVMATGLVAARNEALASLALLALAATLALLAYRDLSAGLEDLVGGVEAAASGRSVAVRPDRPPEIVAVADQLNRTLEERMRAEERHRDFLQNASLGASVTTTDGRFLEANPALASMLGYEDVESLVQAGPRSMYSDLEVRRELMERLERDGAFDGVEVRWRRKDGGHVEVRLYGRHLREDGESRFEVISEDITEQRRMREIDAHRQKTEAIGRLAGGVSHEINNILTVIGGNAEVMETDLGGDHPSAQEIQGINRAVARATELTRSLLAISRKDSSPGEELVLEEVVGEVGTMLAKVLPAEVELRIEPVPEGVRVWMNRGHFEQVLLNLSVNARDAMPTGGRLELSVRTDGPDDVVITVADEGEGMDAETRGRIFEPYYTTKDRGRGTGLGLATILGLVDQAGGTVSVQSTPGEGSTFEIRLPRKA